MFFCGGTIYKTIEKNIKNTDRKKYKSMSKEHLLNITMNKNTIDSYIKQVFLNGVI